MRVIADRIVPTPHERADDWAGTLRLIAVRLTRKPRHRLHRADGRLARFMATRPEHDAIQPDQL
jgi:hypothetical protein